MNTLHGIQTSLRNQQQQGDVCLDLVPLPPGLPPRHGRCILAYGEATGHIHEVLGDSITSYEDRDVLYICVEEAPATLVHEEHQAQVLGVTPPGKAWRCRIVREYDHFAEEAKWVVD